MTGSLRPGLTHRVRYTIPESKLVPDLYPNIELFQEMPKVFATGFLVGLIELSASRCVNPHIDWPEQVTVGTHLDISHESPTPAGMVVMATAELTTVDERRLVFDVEALDEVDVISSGTHERFIVEKETFENGAQDKLNYRGSIPTE